MRMNESVTTVKNAVVKNGKRMLAVAATGLALATASVSSHALEVTGTLDTFGKYGLDELAYSYTPGDYTFITYGKVTFTLFDAMDQVVDPSSFGAFVAPKSNYYNFEGLSGIYTVTLFGAAGTPYKLTISGDLGTAVTPVPEPESMVLALAGLGVLVFVGRRRGVSGANV